MSFNAPTVTRPKNVSDFVVCNLDEHTPRGAMPEPHPITADCVIPRAVQIVLCDRHAPGGVKFAPHQRSFACKEPIPAGASKLSTEAKR